MRSTKRQINEGIGFREIHQRLNSHCSCESKGCGQTDISIASKRLAIHFNETNEASALVQGESIGLGVVYKITILYAISHAFFKFKDATRYSLTHISVIVHYMKI